MINVIIRYDNWICLLGAMRIENKWERERARERERERERESERERERDKAREREREREREMVRNTNYKLVKQQSDNY